MKTVWRCGSQSERERKWLGHRGGGGRRGIDGRHGFSGPTADAMTRRCSSTSVASSLAAGIVPRGVRFELRRLDRTSSIRKLRSFALGGDSS